MKTDKWVCADCFGELEVKGYFNRYFECLQCGCKNVVMKRENKDKGKK